MSANEQRLVAVLRGLVESYDDTGCDGCGVVSQSAYEAAEGVLATVRSSDTSVVADAGERFIDPFEIVVGENPGPLNLNTPPTNDPIDW